MAAAGWAFLATLYWGGMAVVYALTMFSTLALLAGAGAFVLLCWAIRDGAGPRPRRSSYWVSGLSALYTAGACWTFGLAAYIEGHGCALQPETCTGGGVGLAGKVLVGAVSLYFGSAWLVARRRRDEPLSPHRLAGRAEDRQESE
jgi:hypothetical protein